MAGRVSRCRPRGVHCAGFVWPLTIRESDLPRALQAANPFKGLNELETRLLCILGAGAFVLASTYSSINVALPEVQHEFDISLSALKWVSIIGAIMVASLSLTFGRVGDLSGRTRVYRFGLIVYGLGSLFTAALVLVPAAHGLARVHGDRPGDGEPAGGRNHRLGCRAGAPRAVRRPLRVVPGRRAAHGPDPGRLHPRPVVLARDLHHLRGDLDHPQRGAVDAAQRRGRAAAQGSLRPHGLASCCCSATRAC